MILLWTGFLFGLLGSLHCLGMCAPLIWAIPESQEGKRKWWLNKLAYNSGRAITYALLGVIIGLIGESLSLAGWQQYISIFTGALMLLFLVFSKGQIPQSFMLGPVNRLIHQVKSALARFIKGNSPKTNLILGLYNGLLPCGLVYMALIASLSMSSVQGSMLYMLVFGLGTFPMMIAAAYFGSRIKNWNKNLHKVWVPRFVALVAILLIIRGLNLGVPYLSPKVDVGNDIVMCESP